MIDTPARRDGAHHRMNRKVENQLATDTPLLRLEPMNAEEYESRRGAAIDDHAGGIAKVQAIPFDKARQASERQIGEMMPQGVQTLDMLLRTAWAGDRQVGWIWIGLPRTPDRPETAWIYYIAVDPDHRGNGYGRAILLAVEHELSCRGVPRLGLNVFGYNTAAIGLYRSLGYEVTAQQMAKPLQDSE
jgi:ribosomal protein S18 acetylase RimI-like enzyme